jgi:hypothetical protein
MHHYSAVVHRPTSRRFLTALAAIVLTTLAAAPAGASSPHLSATQLIKDGLGAAKKSGTMSFSDKSTSGKVTQMLVGVVSPSGGVESLTQSSQAVLQLEMVTGTLYVRTSSEVLQNGLELPAAVSTANAGKWISLQSTDGPFASLAGQLTLAAELETFVPTSHLRVDKEVKVAGHLTVPVSGSPAASVANGATSGSAAILLSAKAPYLPVGGSLILSKKGSPNLNDVAVFGNWGKSIKLTAPAGAVPYSSIAG